MSECHIRYASDGTAVRVRGDIEQGLLDELTAEVRAMVERRCKAISDVPMPAIAQRLHKRETYGCYLDGGHDGPHRWPEDGSCAEWTTEPEDPGDYLATDPADRAATSEREAGA